MLILKTIFNVKKALTIFFECNELFFLNLMWTKIKLMSLGWKWIGDNCCVVKESLNSRFPDLWSGKDLESKWFYNVIIRHYAYIDMEATQTNEKVTPWIDIVIHIVSHYLFPLKCTVYMSAKTIFSFLL